MPHQRTLNTGNKIICGFVVLATCFFFFADGYTQTNKVTIGYANFSPTYAPVWIAKEMGFFDRHNLNVDIIFVRGGAMGTQALVGRSFDFIVAGGVAAVEAALSGAAIVIVAVPSNRMDQVFVARKEITDPGQLKGKKIAVNSVVGSAILAFKIMLQALGINPDKDVTYVTSGDPATRLAALQSGLVDATGLSPPFTLTAKRAGFNVFDNIPILNTLEYPSASLIVRQESLRKDAAAIDKATRSMIEAVHFFKTHKSESKRILQKYLRLQNPDELEEAYVALAARFVDKPYPTTQSVKTILDWSRHPKAKTADPALFIAPQFVEKLDKEGFIAAVLKK
ncbi:MAG TPA: ABC transporter substrate-binding protein [Candidatus Acidoferrales bacterium]|nr:ABC transporter substrate-binding protein [Candidatus Acidoferrales bacterium]